ncbi:MAG TPA: methyltransferase domain-containing protein [Terriglobia bacterium]|nr:methyltransferase domain-containing protein [Terriglobia bacterium]
MSRRSFFQYNEPSYYGFGLRLGIANLFRNGFSLGLKRTVGLVTQPINSHWRFPEYHFLGSGIQDALTRCDRAKPIRILDVGSPKCFGMYLAHKFAVEAHLTDIDAPTLREAEGLWGGGKHKAKGAVHLSLQDARSLGYPDACFDVVFSMSVVEHIEGREGDIQAIREMVRVLKPGGTLGVSVPFGPTYAEQEIVGFRGGAQKTNDHRRYFFQRIYSDKALESRILGAAPGFGLLRRVSVGRSGRLLWRTHGRLGPIPGLLGFLYPVLSTLSNSVHEGLVPPPGRYGELNTPGDIYGDAILVLQKPVVPGSLGQQSTTHAAAAHAAAG